LIGHLGFLNQVSNQISLQVAHFDPESLAHFNPDLMAHFNPESLAHFNPESLAHFNPEYPIMLTFLLITLFSIKFPVNISPDSWSFLFFLLETKYKFSPN
jgi:hypothetical protein